MTDQTPVPAFRSLSFLQGRLRSCFLGKEEEELLRNLPLGSQEDDHSPCPQGDKYIAVNAETEVSTEVELTEGMNAPTVLREISRSSAEA